VKHPIRYLSFGRSRKAPNPLGYINRISWPTGFETENLWVENEARSNVATSAKRERELSVTKRA
jgi:hypothetical protein